MNIPKMKAVTFQYGLLHSLLLDKSNSAQSGIESAKLATLLVINK